MYEGIWYLYLKTYGSDLSYANDRMLRRVAYLCGMRYLDYDQTMTQDFAQLISPLRLCHLQ